MEPPPDSSSLPAVEYIEHKSDYRIATGRPAERPHAKVLVGAQRVPEAALVSAASVTLRPLQTKMITGFRL